VSSVIPLMQRVSSVMLGSGVEVMAMWYHSLLESIFSE